MKLWEFVEHENVEDLLVYKHPCQDFNTNTKLIVREGQVAVFLHNGQVADVFQAGRHKLSTENLPILGKLIRSLTTGGVNTFSAEVFFISTTNVMSLKWGTSMPMDVQDPKYNIAVKVNGCGEASFRITDALSFFKAFVGTMATLEKADLLKFFRSTINMYIKNAVSRAVGHTGVSVLDLNSYLVEIADITKKAVNEKIHEQGIEITLFSFENLGTIEGDVSLKKLREILAKKAEMEILGYTYQQERSYNVMDTMASKGGGSANAGIASTIIEAGVGFGMAGAVAGTMKNIAQPVFDTVGMSRQAEMQQQDMQKCANCGVSIPKIAKFCLNCGTPVAKKRFCLNCGVELSVNAKFCNECGAKQE